MPEQRYYNRSVIVLAMMGAATVLATNPAAAWSHDCKHRMEMAESLSAAGLKRLEVHAKAGILEIHGRNTDMIAADGKACATTPELLEAVRWRLERNDDLAILTIDVPQTRDDDHARLDVVIGLPEGLDIDVTDSSGSIVIERVGAVRLRDGSGSITIDDIDGPLLLRDGSGSVELTNVRDNVDIEDSAGSLDVRDVDGTVRISDSSGSMTVRGISGSVEVDRDGSGSISVADVGGNFVVRRDGSGSISHRRVTGEVRIPD